MAIKWVKYNKEKTGFNISIIRIYLSSSPSKIFCSQKVIAKPLKNYQMIIISFVHMWLMWSTGL